MKRRIKNLGAASGAARVDAGGGAKNTFQSIKKKPTRWAYPSHRWMEDEEEWTGFLDWDAVAASAGQSSS